MHKTKHLFINKSFYKKLFDASTYTHKDIKNKTSIMIILYINLLYIVCQI